MLGQPGDALLGLAHALAPFEAEGLGDDPHGEGADLLGHLGQDRGRTGAGTAAHAGGDEDQIGTLQRLLKLGTRLFSRFLADHRIATRTQTAGELLPQLDALVGRRLQQRLGIGVEHAIAEALELGADHAVDRIAATSTDADHFDACRLTGDDSRIHGGGLGHRGLKAVAGWLHYVGQGRARHKAMTHLCAFQRRTQRPVFSGWQRPVGRLGSGRAG